MEYLSLYRKWRPQTFSEIKGQEPIVRTLENALQQERVAHAYLFAGPRGTGKTSTAKILAKSLNCVHGVTASPCGECESCKKIKNGYAIDVLEIDAASNRGIDEIRDLREKVKFLPSVGRYKVYIIDEVHMLTTEAFNALLKTLEEPPAHVVFVLATTELHKIPATILSRCQCFEFKPISLREIKGNLAQVAQEEELEISVWALHLLASNAQGGMRDALSLLDQVISFRGKKIELPDVEAILGLADQENLFQLAEVLVKKDASQVIELVQRLVEEGKDLHQFVKGAIGHFRNLLLFKLVAQPEELLAVLPEEVERLNQQSLQYRKGELIKVIENLSASEREMKWSFQARWSLEVALLKLIEPPEESRLAELAEKVKALEELLVSGTIEKPVEEKVSPPARKAPKGSKREIMKEAEAEENSETVPHGEEKTGFASAKVTLEEVQDVWPVVLEKVKKQKRSYQAYLLEGILQAVEGNQLILAFYKKFIFHKENAEKPEVKDLVEKFLQQVLHRELKLKCVLKESREKEADPQELHGKEPLTSEEELLKNPLIKGALELFGGRIIEIKEEGNGEEK